MFVLWNFVNEDGDYSQLVSRLIILNNAHHVRKRPGVVSGSNREEQLLKHFFVGFVMIAVGLQRVFLT